MATILCEVSVCTDCYFEYHTGNDMRDMSIPFDRPPLSLLAGEDLTDGDNGEDGDGLGFSWSLCQGCGSTLGGDRFALTVWGEVD